MPRSKDLKICSLLPSSTEILCLLGLEDRIAGVSHECDFPEAMLAKPRVTRSLIPEGLSSRAIDRTVSALLREGGTLYELDMDALKKLQPDLVITQRLCDVCAVSYENVARAVHALRPVPKVLTIEPSRLADIYDSIRLIGRETGKEKEAADAVEALERKAAVIAAKVRQAGCRPSVFCMEWIDPPYCGGHWLPEIAALAGGEDRLGKLGEDSVRVSWEAVRDYDPEIIVIMCCGWKVPQTLGQIERLYESPYWEDLRAVRSGRVYVTDSNYFSRSGPRIVDGLEILARIFHPQLFPEPFPPEIVTNLPQKASR